MEKLTFLFLFATVVVLAKAQTCGPQYPRWPADFLWSYNGPRSGYHCVQIKEPSDPNTWNDNFFCQKAGRGIRNIGMRWSYNGQFLTVSNYLLKLFSSDFQSIMQISSILIYSRVRFDKNLLVVIDIMIYDP